MDMNAGILGDIDDAVHRVEKFYGKNAVKGTPTVIEGGHLKFCKLFRI